jgi:23S rRNA (adenine2503-C2)-methyltransferase
MTLGELEQFVVGMGQPKFRAKQIMEWLHRGAPDFSVMKNLPEDFRARLNETARTLPARIVKKLESSDDQTTKFLLELQDFEVIETVLMKTTYGNSVCVSSQAGCAMGCKFCASTLLGLKRNLTMNEMTAQVLVAGWELRQFAEREGLNKLEERRAQSADVDNCKLEDNKNNSELLAANSPSLCALRSNNFDVSHIVVMGTGEPLQNTENVKGFLEYANANLAISWRRMTVSTCGLVPGINELSEWGRPVNLAISLHSPTDALRDQIMPVNKKYPIAQVLDAAFAHSAKTGRQLMIEYILLAAKPQEELKELNKLVERRAESADVDSCKFIDNNEPNSELLTPNSPSLCALRSATCNCAPEHAEELSALLKGRNCMVNIIPWNAVAEREFAAPSGNAVHRFQDILINNGIHTRIRKERGADIGSACGQLRLGQR